MYFVSQTVAGILRGSLGSSNNKEKCDHCENYTCQKHHFAHIKPTEEYKNYITLLQQCSSETANSEDTKEEESESIKSSDENCIVATQRGNKKVDFSD